MPDTDAPMPLCGYCNYPLEGIDQPKCPKCGSEYDPTDSNTFNATGIPISAIERYLIAAPPGLVLIISIAIITWGLWILREPQNAMQGLWFLGWYFGICPMVVGLRLAQLILRIMVRYKYNRAAYLKRFRSKYPAWPFLAAMIISSSWAAEQRMPMYWAFHFSEKALNALADKAIGNPSGLNMLTPKQAGLYMIQSIDVYDNGHILLYTDIKWGFARLPEYGADNGNYEEYLFRKENPYEQYDVTKEYTIDNIRIQRIKDDWFIVYNLYYYCKRGWS